MSLLFVHFFQLLIYSYKNHKSVRKDSSEWIVTENTHEPIVSQELWDRVREAENSVSRGKRAKDGATKPLSGLMYCCDCGYKMKMAGKNFILKNGEKYRKNFYNCSSYASFGNCACTSHYITQKEIESAVLADIRSMAGLIISDEKKAKEIFLEKKEQQTSEQTACDIKKLDANKHRLAELDRLMQSVYEDKVLGKIPEHICVNLLQKYESEQKTLSAENENLEEKLSAVRQSMDDVEEFIRRLKNYVDVQALTREMCLELIEYITVDEYKKEGAREIHTINEQLKKMHKK